MRRLAGVIGCWLLVLDVSLAQEDAPWPPDPDTFFVPGVEILSSTVSDNSSSTNDTPSGFCKPVERLQRSGDWHFYQDEITGEMHLCNAQTNQLSEPLLVPTYSDIQSIASPNNNWVVFFGVLGQGGIPEYFTVYSYQVDSGDQYLLGQIPYDRLYEYIFFSEWVSDTKGSVFYITMPESLSDRLYAFDASQPDSLQLVGNGWFIFHDDPARFEDLRTKRFLEYKTGAESDPVPCSLTVYDAYGVNQFELGKDCTSLLRLGNYYFYLAIETRESSEGVLLMQLSRVLGYKHELFHGEIESLDSVSPDGRYVVLLMDNNGRIDALDTEFLDWIDLTESNAFAAIWDTQLSRMLDDFVYASEILQPQDFSGNARYIQWIDDKTVLLGIEQFSLLFSVRLIALNSRGFTLSVVNDIAAPFVLSPDRKSLLAVADNQDSLQETLGITTFSNSMFQPIISADVFDSYTLGDMTWETDDAIMINVHPKSDYDRLITYIIRPPNLITPN